MTDKIKQAREVDVVESELKPCPFCGGDAEVLKCVITDKCWILDHTGCDIKIAIAFKTREQAIKAWNTRTTLRDMGEMK